MDRTRQRGWDAPHLFQHQDTVARPDELGQLCDAALVEVGPGEAAVVEVDLWTAVLPVPLPCSYGPHTEVSRWDALWSAYVRGWGGSGEGFLFVVKKKIYTSDGPTSLT